MMTRKKIIPLLIILFTSLFLSVLLIYQFTQSEDERFTSYINDLFRQEVSSNAITLHYSLKNPSAFHIYNTPLNLGRITTDSDSIGSAAENALATLYNYQRSRLNEENQLIYDLLENTFSTTLNLAPYTLYEEPLSPLTGTQTQLPILMSEYQFHTTKDVDVYLKLLKNFPQYFEEIINFETRKSELGLFMSRKRADSVIEECQAFISMGTSNYLYETFNNKLKKLNLSPKEYQDYIEKNDFAIRNYVYPSYESLKAHLSKLKTSDGNENGLFYLPDGKKYYELLVKNVTGSDRTILELQMLTLKQLNQDLKNLQSTIEKSQNNISLSYNYPGILEDSNPVTLLNSLKDKLSGNFPSPPDVDTSIKHVAESMESYLSPAFYLIPAIDNSNENIIYINPSHLSDNLTLFTTLAHEGYPGHLYQTTYFTNTNPAPIRYLLGYSGYTEGWATYCEMMSYYFAPISKSESKFMQKQSSIMLGLYTLADIGIHYEGWTLHDTIEFFNTYGIMDTAAIEEIFNLIIGDPANYLKYYIGYVEFLELKKAAMKSWGKEFTQERFHREILEAGPMPFSLLNDQLGTG